jgi:hypothetical protein
LSRIKSVITMPGLKLPSCTGVPLASLINASVR